MLQDLPGFDKSVKTTSSEYGTMGRVFLFTNENIGGYCAKTNLVGKDVLAVGASGDHAFESLFDGAKSVDTFDVNFTQKPVIELKQSMIQELPYENFMDFFFDKENFFDQRILQPIWNDLPNSVHALLNLYYSRAERGKRMFYYDGINPNKNHYDKIRYLRSQESYEKLQEKLQGKEIKFTHCDIHGLGATLHKKYDVIMFSNIFDFLYADIADNMQAFNAFYQRVLCPISKNNLSTDGGQIFLHYMWGQHAQKRSKMLEDWQKFCKMFNRKNSGRGQSLDTMPVPSMSRQTHMDNVFVLQQQKVK